MTPDIETLDTIGQKSASRRSFLTRGAAGAGLAVAGATVISLMENDVAGAAVGAVTLTAPTRIFDSRPGQSFGGTGSQGIMTRGVGDAGGRLIGLGTVGGTDFIPDGSAGAFINLAITNTVATGALGITSGSAASPPTASAINWFTASEIVANGLLVPTADVSTGGKGNTTIPSIKVWCIAGTSGVSAAHFVIDLFGYVG